MKKLVLVLGLLASMKAFGFAEIQIFGDYQGPNNYNGKLVSYPGRLISAGYLYQTNNGACFWGDPNDALELFKQMIIQFNYETGHWFAMASDSTIFYDAGDTQAPALYITGLDDQGQWFPWFPRIRMCDRQSLPEERVWTQWPQQ